MRSRLLLIALTVLIALPAAAASQSSSKSSRTTSAKREVLPFIADDYAKALASARAKNLPLFIEAWAPW